MRIAIMGAGAVGGYFGAVLSRFGEDVLMIARGKHGEAMLDNGLRVSSFWGEFTAKPQIMLTTANAGYADVVLFCVKLYSVAEAAGSLAPLVGNGTTIVTLQNGLQAGEVLARLYGWDKVAEAATYIESEIAEPGFVRQHGKTARIEIGARNQECFESLSSIVPVLQKTGSQATIVPDIRSTLWTKLISVGAFGSVMAAARASLEEVSGFPEGEIVLRHVMSEIASVARAEGAVLPETVVEDKLQEGMAEVQSYRSSLLADLLAGKPLEVEYLLGAVVHAAMKKNIPVPASATLITALRKFVRP